MLSELIDILTNFGGGKGGEASGTVVRFLLPTFFWLILAYISGVEWKSRKRSRDLFMSIAATFGILRELTMFFAEYGSYRRYFDFASIYRFYPPLEHAATMLGGVLIIYAFMRYGARSKRYQIGFLGVGVGATLTIYLATAFDWPLYLNNHPNAPFGLYWGDFAFRVTAAVVFGVSLILFILDKMQNGVLYFPLLWGVLFLFLDELLMIFNIVTAEQYVSYFAPIRHNLHIWSIPFFIATYWSELKNASIQNELELKKQHDELEELNRTLEERVKLASVEMQGAITELGNRDWFVSGQNQLNETLRGDTTTEIIADKGLSFLVRYLNAAGGLLYVVANEKHSLELQGTFGIVAEVPLRTKIRYGEGVVGQVAKDCTPIILHPVPRGYLPVGSPVNPSDPLFVVTLPAMVNNELYAVIEIGWFRQILDGELNFFKQAAETIALMLQVAIGRQKVDNLLEQTQSQAEELRVQQEELQQTNEELEERAQVLEQQREQIRHKNSEIEKASEELKGRAQELERVSAYKSQFLANMSHELRTPLNSMMILSTLLKDNRDRNLTERQVEFASTINNAGRDLLNLINDILDLSKIEAGKLDFNFEEFSIEELSVSLQSVFMPITADKGIELIIDVEPDAPKVITGDQQRIQQILKNLLSNACKFTSVGGVTMRVFTPLNKGKTGDDPIIGFSVSDTGIGIPADKIELVFQAFKQVDGSTSRIYGGTGLGLSIALELARSMGGSITVSSEEGVGSSFTLLLPVTASCVVPQEEILSSTTNLNHITIKASQNQTVLKIPTTLPPPIISDDRDSISENDKSILIIEDDLSFARVLLDMVRGRSFSGIVAADGESGIALAEFYKPSAILLDVMLPHIDGWGVMHYLKESTTTRHIPVHFITCLEERQKAMSMGAVGYVTKPVSKEQLDSVFGTIEKAIDKTMKMLLIVEDDSAQAAAMVALLENRNISISIAESGAKAIELLSSETFDCIVLDLGLADMGAFELLEEMKKLDPNSRIPVIIHTGRDLTQAEEKRLHHYAESIIIKGAKSPERLLNEVTLFLHLVETSLTPDKQRMIRGDMDKESVLDGKKILIVDDDMRNIFSLSSALSEKNMIIMEAENGREALQILDQNRDIDLVLMDIMMPEMDGYEAMRTIRNDPNFGSLPIIALTAKAMKGDREECLKAGANDYIPKPVDMDKLLSLLRVWLYQK